MLSKLKSLTLALNTFIGVFLIFCYSPLINLVIGVSPKPLTTLDIINFSILKSTNYGNIDLNAAEISHLQDIQKLIVIVWIVFIMGLVAQTILNNIKKSSFKKTWVKSLIITTVIIILISLYSYFSFHSSFIFVHQIFFPAGNWEFDPSNSQLIQMFPEELFVNFVKFYVLIYYVFQGIIFCILNFKQWQLKLGK
jgi:integral membrane protein (TIGR01906 family)